MTGYMQLDQMGQIHPSLIPGQLIEAYRMFFLCWQGTVRGMAVNTQLQTLLKGCVLLLTLLVVWGILRQFLRGKPWEGALALLLAGMFPVAVNLICLSGQSFVHTLMFYPMCLVPLVFLALCERWNAGRDPRVPLLARLHTAGRWVCVCLVAVLAFQYARQANEVYLEMQINHSRRVAYWTSIATQIRSLPGFSEWTEVVFLYEDGWDRSTPGQWNHEHLNELIGVRLDYHSYADQQLLNYYLGYAPHYLDPAEFEALPEVQEMPTYPDDGSVRMIEGAAVVKF